jgi:hypothetical protein
MKPTLVSRSILFAGAALLSTTLLQAENLMPAPTPEVAFSSLDALGSYSYNYGIRISGASAFPIGYEAYACQFAPLKSGFVSSIELGLGYSSWGSPASQVDVRLSLAIGGLPLDTLLLDAGTVTTGNPFGSGGLTSFIPASPVAIETGQSYWLTVTPHSDTTASVWCNPAPTFDQTAMIGYTSPYGPGGLAWYMGQSLLPAGTKAFRVNVVPEPSIPTLLGFAAVAAGTARRRPAR